MWEQVMPGTVACTRAALQSKTHWYAGFLYCAVCCENWDLMRELTDG